MVQGGGWGAVLKQGGGHCSTSCVCISSPAPLLYASNSCRPHAPSSRCHVCGRGDRLVECSVDEAAWKALLSLAVRPQVHVKVSALFRLSAGGKALSPV